MIRNKTIDFLRGIAVLLTLFRHSPYTSIFIELRQIGWVGVDLFFVLSGFLVSGLIFDEYSKTDTFKWRTFLVRRGFKIYPAFWVLIISTICFKFWTSGNIDYAYGLKNFFFIQNYFNDTHFNHTWSLCVEEHFYFFLVLFFMLILKYSKNISQSIFRGSVVLITYGIIAKVILFFVNKNFSPHTHIYPSHLRIDSLMIGTLLAYLYKNKPHYIVFINKHKVVGCLLTLLGFSLPFLWDIDKPNQQLYMSGFGLSFLSLSFGIMLVLLLSNNTLKDAFEKRGLKFFLNIIVTIGFYSYSIYLWHILTKETLILVMYHYFSYINGYLLVFIYLISCILAGIILGKIIEIPFLNIRDRYFPKKY